MAGTISKSNSGTVTTATSVVTSWASGAATSGRALLLIVSMSNVLSSGTPTGWTQLASNVNNQDLKVFGRTADGTATDTPTLTYGTCGGSWRLIEISGVSAVDVVGTFTFGAGAGVTSSVISATPTAGARFMLAIYMSSANNAATWTAPTPSWSNSFVDDGFTVALNGAGGVNDADRISVGTRSATVTATAQTTQGTLLGTNPNSTPCDGMIIYQESAGAAGSMVPVNPMDALYRQLIAR